MLDLRVGTPVTNRVAAAVFAGDGVLEIGALHHVFARELIFPQKTVGAAQDQSEPFSGAARERLLSPDGCLKTGI